MGNTRTASDALFPLGQIVATPGALETMHRYCINGLELLSRHARGDWGDLDTDDREANDDALDEEARILSAYGTGDRKLWVITEADRSVTTILRPDEY